MLHQYIVIILILQGIIYACALYFLVTQHSDLPSIFWKVLL